MNKTANQKLGSTLRRLRKARGFSQEGFAQAARIERARYGRMERGELNISLKALYGLAAQLNMPPGELLTDITVEDCREDDAAD